MQGIPQSPHCNAGDLMSPTGSDAEAQLVVALQRGDEQAFVGLIATHHRAMIHTAPSSSLPISIRSSSSSLTNPS